MATAASQTDIPPPADVNFVNGESAVGIAAAAGTVTRYFAREFVVPRSGLYLIKLWVNGGGIIKLGRDLATSQTIITAPAGQTIQTQINLKKGVNRMDVQAVSSTDAFFAMLIYHPDEVLYVSSNEGWVYEDAAAPTDLAVPDGALAALPVFSILPNWADGITERLSYLTDILTSETAAEQPRLLRLHPRREFEAAFLRKGVLRSRLDAFLVGIGRRSFLMPLWHEQYRVAAVLNSGTSFVQFPAETLALREFQVGDQVFVNDGDPDKYEVLKVASLDYNLDRLYWTTNPVLSWPVGTRIIPLRKARIVDQAQMSAPVDRVARGSLRFALEDPEYRFGASWGRCSPVWHFPINRADDITFSYDRLTYVMDNSTGPVDYFTPGERALIAMRSALILRGRSMMVAFRRFVDQAGGRAGRFYMPTRMQDIQPVGQTISGANLDAVSQGFTDYNIAQQEARGMIGVVFTDGSPNLYRRVVQVERVSLTSERFTLNVALPLIDVSRIERIQYMVPSRFDQDTFEFAHQVDESAAVRTTVVTRSLDSDGMPDIDCYVTSLSYPVESVDGLSVGFGLMDVRLISSPKPIDEMALGISIDDGAIRVGLKTYNESPEGLNVGFSFNSGKVYRPLVTEELDDESLNVAFQMTSGTERVALLTEELEDEAMNMTFALTAGTLT